MAFRDEKRSLVPFFFSSETLNSIPCFHLFPKISIGSTASHHYQPIANKGESKTVATTPAMTPPATLLAINTPTPTTEASMEDVATFVQPLAMILAEGNSGGPVGATLRSADLPGRPTRGV